MAVFLTSDQVAERCQRVGTVGSTMPVVSGQARRIRLQCGASVSRKRIGASRNRRIAGVSVPLAVNGSTVPARQIRWHYDAQRVKLDSSVSCNRIDSSRCGRVIASLVSSINR